MLVNNVAFIVTKPLQLIVSLAIIDEFHSSEGVDLIVTNGFFDAINIYNLLKNKLRLPQSSNVFFFSEGVAYKYVARQRYSKLYIDSDIGARKWCQLFALKAKCREIDVRVYEEGVGTYRTDLYAGKGIFGSVKRQVFDYFGVGMFFGGCTFTSKIFVYHPSKSPLYGKKDVVRISRSIESTVADHHELSSDIFSPGLNLDELAQSSDEIALLYLSGWHVDYSYIEKLREIGCVLIVKPHPHIKDLTSIGGVAIANASVPAEILIMKLADLFGSVVVHHHGSSAASYIFRKNVRYVEI